jgi:hypothetical protein
MAGKFHAWFILLQRCFNLSPYELSRIKLFIGKARGEEHGVNRAERFFPGTRPIGSQYDIAPWPVFVDVCSIHILNSL